MKNFLKMVFASTLGVCLASVILSLFAFFLFLAVLAGSGSSPQYKPAKNSVLKIDLSGVVSDRVVDDPLGSLFGDVSGQQSLDNIIQAIKKAKENDHISGIYLKGSLTFSAGTASIDAIRTALKDFKESGKFIVAYGDNYSQSSYYVSSLADKVFLNPEGMVNLHGMAATPMFYTGLLEKLGVKVEIFKVGTFKSAVEPYMLDKMSEANREQVTSYMGSIWNNISSTIAADRGYTADSLNALIDKGLLFAAPAELLKGGLVDSLLFVPEVEEYFEKRLDVEEVKMASVSDMQSVPWKKKKEQKDKIAILYAEGEITDARSGLFQGNSVISDKEYVEELRKLKDDKEVKAVVFRINSPGGSGYISEQIWKEVVELKKEKPIVVSMGDVAASGGYYIACAADWIIAQPTTITGSIGVFGMFPNFEGLYGKVGLTSDVVKTNTYADLGDPSRAMRADEKALVQNYVERFYDIFLTRCADGRGKTKAAIDSIGQGRVWSGEQALSIGLVDELGDLYRAVEVAAEKAGIENYSTVKLPQDKDFLTLLLEESLGNVKTRMMKEMLDDTEYRHLLLISRIKQQDIIQARLPFDF